MKVEDFVKYEGPSDLLILILAWTPSILLSLFMLPLFYKVSIFLICLSLCIVKGGKRPNNSANKLNRPKFVEKFKFGRSL